MRARHVFGSTTALSLFAAALTLALGGGSGAAEETATARPQLAQSLGDLFGGGTKTKVTSGSGGQDLNAGRAEAYDGPKARIAVTRFTNKTNERYWWNDGIGEGMADQLTTALFNTGRYIVLERQTLDDVLSEQDLAAAGRVKQGSEARIGEIEGAELLVVGAVTEFEDAASGTRGSAGGTFGNVLGAITGGVKRSHMAIDLRIIDATTSRILAATSVEGEATDVDLGGLLGGWTGSGGLTGALSGWSNTPTEKALRQCIEEAVRFVVSKTPQQFYHYGAGQQVASATPATQQPAAVPQVAPQRQVPAYQVGDYARVTSNSLNIRSGPSTGHGVVFSAPQGTPLAILAVSGDWAQIRDPQGRSGWAAAWLTHPDSGLTAADFAAAAPTAPVTAPAASVPTPSVSATSSLQAPPPAAAATSTAPAASTGGGASSGGGSVADRLAKLKTLKDQGLISEEQYQQKAAEILADL